MSILFCFSSLVFCIDVHCLLSWVDADDAVLLGQGSRTTNPEGMSVCSKPGLKAHPKEKPVPNVQGTSAELKKSFIWQPKKGEAGDLLRR